MEHNYTQLRREIVAAVRKIEVSDTEAWRDLSLLASDVRVNDIEMFEEEIRIDGDRFSGALLWYVTLIYGSSDDQVVSSESFHGKFEGKFVDNTPIVDRMTVDTSSFYA